MGCNGSKSDGTENQSPPAENKAEGKGGGTPEEAAGEAQPEEGIGGFLSGAPTAVRVGVSGMIDKHVSEEHRQDVKDLASSPKRVVKEKVSEKLGFGDSGSKEGPGIPSKDEVQNKIETTYDDTKNKAQSKIDSTKESLSERGSDFGNSMSDTAKDKLESIKETANQTASKAESKFKGAVNTATE